jgi:hypothetical protein
MEPIPSTFTSMIAAREFDLVQGEVHSKLTVEIGLPIQDVETINGLDWRCPVRFVNGTSVRIQRACGVDSVQALQLAFRLVENDLMKLSKLQNTHVQFRGEPFCANGQIMMDIS